MGKLFLSFFLVLGLPAWAHQPEITRVVVEQKNDLHKISVGIRHVDEGWHHYIDKWSLRTPEGEDIATRDLHHPHTEFRDRTGVFRAISGIEIPAGITQLDVHTHDTQSGWSGQTYRIDLDPE